MSGRHYPITESTLPGFSDPSAFSDPLTTNGDIIARIGGVTTRLGIGSPGQVLTVAAGLPAWVTPSSGFADPMTTAGDIIIRNALNVTTRLGVGTAGQVLTVVGGVPAWAATYTDPLTTDGDIVARIGGVTTRVAIGTAGQVLGVSSGLPAWIAPPAAGLDTQIQYNSSGSLAGTQALTFTVATTRFQGTQLTASQNFMAISAHASVSNDVFRVAGSAIPAGGGYIVAASSTASLNAWIVGNVGTINYGVIGYSANASNFALGAEYAASTATGYRTALRLNGEPSSAPSADFGIGTLYALRTSTTSRVDAGYHGVAWSTTAHLTRTSYHVWQVVNSASSLTEAMRLTGDGALRVGTSSIYFGLRPAGSGTTIWTMPAADGTSGQALTTNGSAVLGWTSLFTDPMTTIGDIIIRNGSNVTARLGIGTAGQVLTVVGGVPVWQTPSSGFADPMTTIGDIIIRNGSNVTARLGIGTAGQVLTVVGGVPAWATATASAAGSNTQIQYNSSGSLGASAQFSWDDSNKILTVEGTLASPATILDTLYTGSSTTGAVTHHRIIHRSSGTPTTDFGAAIRWLLKTSTTNDQDAGIIAVQWSNASHTSQTSYISFSTVWNGNAIGETFRIAGNGFHTRTLITSQTSTFDTVETITLTSSGTAANNFGLRRVIQLETSSSVREAMRDTIFWVDANDVTRNSRYRIDLANATNMLTVLELTGNGGITLGSSSNNTTVTIDGNSVANLAIVSNGGGTAYLDITTSGVGTSEVRIDGTKVLGPRITGWGAPTGPTSRATFATGSVTLPDLAERVAQMIIDNIAHGFYGT